MNKDGGERERERRNEVEKELQHCDGETGRIETKERGNESTKVR